MRQAFSRLRRFLVSDEGPTAVEYAVMTGFVVVTIYWAFSALTSNVSGQFSTVSSMLS
jgi:pilus assembly protein Flp/PilA